MPSYERLENLQSEVQSMYLNPTDADVWFVIDGEKIPAHKSLIKSTSKFLNTLCEPPWQEHDEIPLFTVNASIFKEFLRYLYLLKPNLTMDNIREIMDLTNSAMEDGKLFGECIDFLIESLSVDTMSLAYDLAELYEEGGISERLMRALKEDVCIFAEQIFRSSSFLKFKYNLLEFILRCSSLAYEEKRILNRCLAWAKAACKRSKQDPTAVNLRAQLKESIYHIRFGSMTSEEFASCIQPYPELFTVKELHEIIGLVNRKGGYIGPTQFNEIQRNFDQYIIYKNRGRRLECTRYTSGKSKEKYIVKRGETTSFTCNRRVLLKGLTFEKLDGTECEPINLRVVIQGCTDNIETQRYNRTDVIYFVRKENIDSFEARFNLQYAILLQPNHIYSINVTFTRERGNNENPISCLQLKKKVRVDHDIVFKFKSRGIVTSLNIIRFDKKNYVWKIVHDLRLWFWILVVCTSFCGVWIGYFGLFHHK